MAIQPVDIYVKTPSPALVPLEGVTVRIFDSDGVFVTSSTTDVDGHAGFLLEAGDYTARFFKFQVAFTNPQGIAVSDTLPNTFDVSGVVVTPPTAVDPTLCRVSGVVRQLNGAGAPGVLLHIENVQHPLLLSGYPVLPEALNLKTDKTGYVEFDLVRGAVVEVTLAGMSDVIRNVIVPDAPSVALGSLLFPVVSSVAFTPGTLAVAVDATLDVDVVVLLSSGNALLGTGSRDLLWSSSDETIFTVTTFDDHLALYGRAAGTAELRATPRNTSITGTPELTIAGQPVTVTVT